MTRLISDSETLSEAPLSFIPIDEETNTPASTDMSED